MSKNKATRPHPRPFTDGRAPSPQTMAVDARPAAVDIPVIVVPNPVSLVDRRIGFVPEEET